jgi:cell division protein FtsB
LQSEKEQLRKRVAQLESQMDSDKDEYRAKIAQL